MVARLVRIKADLEGRAKAYTERVGISFNALVLLALTEYLDGKGVQAQPIPEKFELEPSPPDPGEGVKLSREMRRLAERKKDPKPKRF